MIVSRAHDYVFVHVWKTGGTSIAAALAGHIPRQSAPGRLVKRTRNAVRAKLGQTVLGKHAFAVDIRKHIGDDFDRMFSFGFVRNPWDWILSWYNFVNRQNRSPDRGNEWSHHMKSAVGGMSFDRFVMWVVEEDGLTQTFARRHSSFAGRRPVLQRDWLSDLDGNLIVDFVGRFETLADDFETVLGRIGLSGITLPHANRVEHREYTSYYTTETRAAVGRYFEADIDTFRYRFGE